jgi:NAD(P)-dependent dehydrogenase (short-subunit alcohol dehydrogenase family)
VAIGDLDLDLAGKTAAELGATAVALDVADPASFAAFLDGVESDCGALDVLVNNAGIMPSGMFLDQSAALTDKVVAINLSGVMTGTRLAAARFVERSNGCVVNIASVAGAAGVPGLAAYCASKSAVISFTEAVHHELADRGVRVAAVLPGIVRTELSSGLAIPDWMQRFGAIDPDDVARAVIQVAATAFAHPARLHPVTTVPAAMSAFIAVSRLLPRPLQRLLSRASAYDTMFAHADPAARAAYHTRIGG